MSIRVAALLAALVLFTAPALAREHLVAEYSFDKGVSDAVSPDKRYTVGGKKILGLFNDRTKRWPSEAVLSLDNLPAGVPVAVSFDLYLVGNWDSQGELADRFSVRLENGKLLFEMTEFPCRLQDIKDESTAVGNNGLVRVKRRDLGYWIVPTKVVLSPLDINQGKAVLVFKGELTGKGTEFWGLDNIRVTAAPQ